MVTNTVCADLSELCGERQRKIPEGIERIRRKVEHHQYMMKKKGSNNWKMYWDVLYSISKVTVNFSFIYSNERAEKKKGQKV